MLLRDVPLTDPAAAALVDEYFVLRAAAWPDGASAYRVVRPEPAAFVPPAGAFVLLEDDAPGGWGAVGCGGVRLLSPARAEVKHLFVREVARGRGWGRDLLVGLEARARDLGATEVVLDTHVSNVAAHGLYRAGGYREVEPYNANPNATHWFAKDLTPR